MPRVQWKEENRRYALCFFPLIGGVIGGIIYLLSFMCRYLGMTNIFFAALAVAVPFFVTGGIHFDGFMDVCDAMACMGDREKRISVMKDSDIGAFAALHLGIYLLLQVACLYQIESEKFILMTTGCFVVSRAFSALAAVTFKGATGKGSLTNFSEPAHKTATIITELLYLIIVFAGMLYVDLKIGAGCILAAIMSFVYYRIFSYKSFGGITGDLAGYFLQLCELSQLVLIAVMCKLV